MFQNILVICTGNICRSPMADYLLREKLAARGITVSSAGVGALVGSPADPLAVAVADAHGLDLSAHRARQVDAELLRAQDLVLALDQGHADWINARHPAMRGRVHKLLKWRDNIDVADPYRQTHAAFEQAWDAIALGVDDWLARLG